MKIITEEVLRKILKRHFGDDLTNQSLASHLVNECQELDTLTVDRLRPMSDVQEDDILVKWIRENGLRGAFYVDGWVYINGGNYKPEEFEGWVPMPLYEPEKV